jgi:hypothetical protein
VHRLLSEQDQGGSAHITTRRPAAAASLSPDGMVTALEAASAAVSSFVVHHVNLLVLKTLSQ